MFMSTDIGPDYGPDWNAAIAFAKDYRLLEVCLDDCLDAFGEVGPPASPPAATFLHSSSTTRDQISMAEPRGLDNKLTVDDLFLPDSHLVIDKTGFLQVIAHSCEFIAEHLERSFRKNPLPRRECLSRHADSPTIIQLTGEECEPAIVEVLPKFKSVFVDLLVVFVESYARKSEPARSCEDDLTRAPRLSTFPSSRPDNSSKDSPASTSRPLDVFSFVSLSVL